MQMQIKTISYHLLPITMTKIKMMIKSVSKDVEKFEPSHIAGGNAKCWSCFGKFFAVIQNVKHGVTV